VVPYVAPERVPPPPPRENIRLGFNQFTQYLGQQEDRLRGTDVGQFVVEKANSNLEHAPVKGPFFALLSTLLGIGIKKGTVVSPVKRFALNSPVGVLFDTLVDPDPLNTTEKEYLGPTTPVDSGTGSVNGSQFPKLWFSDP